MRRFLYWLASKFPRRVIFDRDGTTPYLTRFYIFGGPRTKGRDLPEDSREITEWKKRPFNVFIHRFHMSDDADALHNHPWKWSFSIILAGGYREERRHRWGGEFVIEQRAFKPGALNIIRAGDYHRVDLDGQDCWTLFIAGPKAKEPWSFWTPATNETTPWWRFIEERRKGARA